MIARFALKRQTAQTLMAPTLKRTNATKSAMPDPYKEDHSKGAMLR